MAVPRPLAIGDLVAVVAPAGKLPERFSKQEGYVLEHLESLGFKVLDLLGEASTSTPERRAEALVSSLSDPGVRAVLPLCGGRQIHETIRLLPSNIPNSLGKIFCGSSELTALNLKLLECSDAQCFHGPHLPFLHKKASFQERHYTVRSFWNMLMWDWHGKNGLDRHEMGNFFSAPKDGSPGKLKNVYLQPTLIRNKRCRDVQYVAHDRTQTICGRIVPGSFRSIIQLLEYTSPALRTGDILLLDCLDQSHTEIERDFSAFVNQAGSIQFGAVFFASCVERSDRAEKKLPELNDNTSILRFLNNIERALGGVTPAFYGFPSGHCAYKLTVPVGVQAKLCTETGSFELQKPIF